jgi:hypothetical protein
MSSGQIILKTAFSLLLAAAASPALSADLACNGLLPTGERLVCPSFEPNWAVELVCEDEGMTSIYVDAFSGPDMITTPGSVSVHSENPWGFSTEHGVAGVVAYTPGGCRDESDQTLDFTLTPNTVPGYTGELAPVCCHIE